MKEGIMTIDMMKGSTKITADNIPLPLSIKMTTDTKRNIHDRLHIRPPLPHQAPLQYAVVAEMARDTMTMTKQDPSARNNPTIRGKKVTLFQSKRKMDTHQTDLIATSIDRKTEVTEIERKVTIERDMSNEVRHIRNNTTRKRQEPTSKNPMRAETYKGRGKNIQDLSIVRGSNQVIDPLRNTPNRTMIDHTRKLHQNKDIPRRKNRIKT